MQAGGPASGLGQIASGAGQVDTGMHWLPAQPASGPHGMLQPPQWSGSRSRLTHCPPQAIRPGGHGVTHEPPAQMSPGAQG